MSRFNRIGLLTGMAMMPLLFTVQLQAAPILLSAGATGTVHLAGVVAGTPLTATAGYVINTFTPSQLVISWTLTNTTPVATPGRNRLVSFGFDLVPAANRTITGSASNNPDWGVSFNNVNITSGTRVDICAWDGNNCAGGANQGVLEGLSESFRLTINGTFRNPLSLSNFYARYQSIGSDGESGIIGRRNDDPQIPMPEPAALALLGIGLLGAGIATRRRAA